MNEHMAESTSLSTGAHPWRAALLFAAPAVGLLLGLIYCWFGVANRSIVFLYDHDMGPRVLDTRPFSPVTRSRYWMAGFVATGFIMVLVIGVNWLLGRLSRRYAAPAWWRVGLLATPPLLGGILWITMTCNRPTLPLGLALLTALVTLVGLALALQPAAWAARYPLDLMLLALDGGCLALLMTTLPGLAYVSDGFSIERPQWVWMLLGLLAVSAIGLSLSTVARWMLRRRLSVRGPGLPVLLVAAACCAYLVLPLFHHLFGTDGYFYITDMDNFFSRVLWVQGLSWAMTAALGWGVLELRRARFSGGSGAGTE